jgi:hypothetical protein
MIKVDMKIPRKKKKQIPVGMYCYTPTSGFKDMGDGQWGFTTKLCPFYSNIKYKDIPINQRPKWMDDEFIKEFGNKTEGWCKLVKTDIMDQCKSCGERYKFK